jgi:ATP-dependent Clp protease ATP-binding subunit ClpC
VFERFDERARATVTLAHEEAAALGAEYIGTEHLLLGLLREPKTVAGRVLANLGVGIDDVRERAGQVRPPDHHVSGSVPLAARSRRVLELAEELAEEHGPDRRVGTQEVLVALVRGDGGPGARILRDLGVGADRVEDAVDELTR